MISTMQNLGSHELARRLHGVISKTWKFEISAARMLLSAYLLTYGVFGYGSAIELNRPLTLVPAAVGVLCGFLVFAWLRRGGADWSLSVTLSLSGLLAFLLILAALVGLNLRRLGDELVGDELAYALITHTHALEFLKFFPDSINDLEAAYLIRVASAIVIIVVTGFLWLCIWRRSVAAAVVTTFAVTIGLQLFYSFFGGWGWGYAKVAWIPHLIGTAFLGLSSEGFRITSLMIVAMGLVVLLSTLKGFGAGKSLRWILVIAIIAMPAPSIYFSTVDHVHFFLVFAVPALYVLVHGLRSHDVNWLVPFLAIGVTLRITVAFALIGVLVVSGISRFWPKTFRDSGPYVMSAALLLPYFIGTLTNPSIAGSFDWLNIQDQVSLIDLVQTLDSQVGLVYLGALIVGLVLFLIRGQPVAGLLVFTLFLVFFYFIYLSESGLAGEYKYSLEWSVSLAVLSILVLADGIRKSAGPLVSLALPGVLVVASLGLSPALVSSQGELIDARNALSPVGYERALTALEPSEGCQPVGVVYGAANELLHGYTWATVFQVSETHGQLQARIRNSGRDWRFAYADLAKELGIICLYGSKDSFPGLLKGAWESWDIVFFSGTVDSPREVVAIKRQAGA